MINFDLSHLHVNWWGIVKYINTDLISRAVFKSKLEILHGVRSRDLHENGTDKPQQMATNTIAPPAPFNFKNGQNGYSALSDITCWLSSTRKMKSYRSTLIYCMGDEADNIVKSFTLAEGDKKNYTKVKEKFDQHFIIKRNLIFEHAKFNMRKQEPSEPVIIIFYQ